MRCPLNIAACMLHFDAQSKFIPPKLPGASPLGPRRGIAPGPHQVALRGHNIGKIAIVQVSLLRIQCPLKIAICFILLLRFSLYPQSFRGLHPLGPHRGVAPGPYHGPLGGPQDSTPSGERFVLPRGLRRRPIPPASERNLRHWVSVTPDLQLEQ